MSRIMQVDFEMLRFLTNPRAGWLAFILAILIGLCIVWYQQRSVTVQFGQGPIHTLTLPPGRITLDQTMTTATLSHLAFKSNRGMELVLSVHSHDNNPMDLWWQSTEKRPTPSLQIDGRTWLIRQNTSDPTSGIIARTNDSGLQIFVMTSISSQRSFRQLLRRIQWTSDLAGFTAASEPNLSEMPQPYPSASKSSSSKP